jgi:branched-chain amino acid transport system ATP-binding protein
MSAPMHDRRVLDVTDVEAGYDLLQVLWGVSLHVNEGEFVALLGPNGAGKTTTLRTIAGFLKPIDGEITFRGATIGGAPAHAVSRMGLGYVSESLNLFASMTVRENLLVGANSIRDNAQSASTMDLVFELFPRLHERRDQLAGTLSGGERKMLAIGRGLMASPSLLLVDEPSLGLAPMATVATFEALKALRERGVTILLVEQNVNTTLHLVDRAYVLEQGRIILEGTGEELLSNPHVQAAYLGI